MTTLQELETRLAALETQLAEQKKRQILRESMCCPGCQNTEIFHITELQAHGLPVRVAQEGVFSITSIGVLELYLCSNCGYGEAQLNPEELKRQRLTTVKVISKADPSPPIPEPYR